LRIGPRQQTPRSVAQAERGFPSSFHNRPSANRAFSRGSGLTASCAAGFDHLYGITDHLGPLISRTGVLERGAAVWASRPFGTVRHSGLSSSDGGCSGLWTSLKAGTSVSFHSAISSPQTSQ
jgi:hypothetical protein